MATKITPAVEEYIRSHMGSMSQREIADKCGISTATVNRWARRIKMGEQPVSPARENASPRNGPPGRDEDAMGRLVELRDMLYDALRDAGGGTLPRLSSEYRAVLAQIHDLEEADAGDGAESKLAGIFADLNW